MWCVYQRMSLWERKFGRSMHFLLQERRTSNKYPNKKSFFCSYPRTNFDTFFSTHISTHCCRRHSFPNQNAFDFPNQNAFDNTHQRPKR